MMVSLMHNIMNYLMINMNNKITLGTSKDRQTNTKPLGKLYYSFNSTHTDTQMQASPNSDREEKGLA